MANQIKYGVKFDVDTKSLNQLKSSLQQIKKVSLDDIMKFNNTSLSSAEKILKSIQEDANKVESALNKAFNTKLNTLNLQTFNRELAAAQTSIDKVYQSFSQGGVVGQTLFNNFSREILHTNAQLQQSSKLLDDMAVSMGNTIKWGITSSIFNNITGSIQKAYYYAKDLDRSLTDIRIVTGDSADQMQRFAKVANTAAGDLGRSTLDYTKAALTFYQQGLSQQDVQARTEATLKAENITGIGEQMADYLTAVWNGFNVGAQDAEKYVDKLAAVADSTASNMGQLATGISKVASAANNVGVNIDQLTGQIATVIATTRQAPESVGVAFRTIYARINDIKAGTDEAQISLGNYSGKMAALGFNVLDATGHLRDTGEVIEEIGERWQSLTKEQQINLAQVMAGQRQYSNLISLFDNWDKYLQSVNTSLNSQGTLNEKNGRYLESLEAHMQQLSTEAERTYDILFDESVVKGFVDVFDGVLKGFNNFISGIGGGVPVLVTFGSTVANIFNKQIADAIASAQDRFDIFINNKNLDAFKDKVADTILSQRLSKGDYDSNYQQAAVEAAKKQAEIYQQIAQVKKGLTQEAYNELAALQQTIGVRTQQISLIENYQSVMDEVSGHEYTTYTEITDKIKEQKDIITEHKQLMNDIVQEARQYVEQVQDGVTPHVTDKQILTEIVALNREEIFTKEERERLDSIHARMSKDQAITDEDIKFLSQALTKQLQYQNTLLEKANQAKSLYDKYMKGEHDSLRAQNAEAEKLVQNGVQRAKNAINLRTTVQNITSGLTAATSALGAINTFTNDTATGAEKVNAAWAGVQGTLPAIAGIIGNTLVPGSGIFVTTIMHGVVALGKQIFKLTGLWQGVENFFKSTSERIQDMNAAMAQAQEKTVNYQDSKSKIEDLADEFETLSKKAGQYNQHIANLTQEQQDRYREIIQEIINLNPSLVEGFTAQGDAIIDNNTALQRTLELLDRQHEKQMAMIYSADQIASNASAVSGAKAAKDQADFYNNNEDYYRDIGLGLKENEAYTQLRDDMSAATGLDFANGKFFIDQNIGLSLIQPLIENISAGGVGQKLRDAQMKYAADLNEAQGSVSKIREANETFLESIKDIKTQAQNWIAQNAEGQTEGLDPTTQGYFQNLIDGVSSILDSNRIEELFGEVSKAKQELADAAQQAGAQYGQALDSFKTSMLGALIYTSDYNSSYKEIKDKMGNLFTDDFSDILVKMIQGQIDKFNFDDQNLDWDNIDKIVAEFVNDGLSSAFENIDAQSLSDTQNNLDKLSEKLEKGLNIQQYEVAVEKIFNDFASKNKKLIQMLGSSKEDYDAASAIIDALFGNFGIKIGEFAENGLPKIESDLEEVQNRIKATIAHAAEPFVPENGNADELYDWLISTYDTNKILEVYEAIKDGTLVLSTDATRDLESFQQVIRAFFSELGASDYQGDVDKFVSNFDKINKIIDKVTNNKDLTYKDRLNLMDWLGLDATQVQDAETILEAYRAKIQELADSGDELAKFEGLSKIFTDFASLHNQDLINTFGVTPQQIEALWDAVLEKELNGLKIAKEDLEAYAQAKGIVLDSPEKYEEALNLYNRQQAWGSLGKAVEGAKKAIDDYNDSQEKVVTDAKTLTEDGSILGYLQQLRESLHNVGLDVDYQWIIDNLEKIGKAAKGSVPDIQELTKGLIESASIEVEVSPKSIQERYKNYEDIEDKATKSGGSITQDEYDTLEPELQAYFMKMLDGTYQLTEAAEKFSEAVNQIQTDMVKEAVDQLNTQIAQLSGLQGIDFETLSQNAGFSQQLSSYTDVSNSGIGTVGMSPMDISMAASPQLLNQQIDYLERFGDYPEQVTAAMQGWRQLTPEAENFYRICADVSRKVQEIGDHTSEIAPKLAETSQQALGLQYAFGKTAESMQQLQQMYNDGNGVLSPEVFNSLAVEMQHMEDMKGLDADQVKQYAEYLENTVDGLSEFEGAAENAAVEILRMNKGVETLAKNFDDWENILSNSTDTSYEYFDAMSQLKDAMSDLTGVSKDFISDNTILNNMEDLKLAADGDADAIDRLKMACANDIIAHITMDSELNSEKVGEIESLWGYLQQNMPNIEAGVTLSGEDEFLDALNQLIAAAGMTAPQVNQLLSGMGFSATFANDPQEIMVQQPDLIIKHHRVTNFSLFGEDGLTGGFAPQWDEEETVERRHQDPIKGKIPNYAFETSEPGTVAVPKISSLTKLGGSMNNYSGGNSGGSSPSGKSSGSGGGKKGGGGGKKGGGGKGKKGSGSDKQKQFKEKQKKEKHEDQVDIYHDVNKQLSNIERALGRLQKKQDKLWGKQLLDNLNKQSALLEQHKQKLQEKLALQQKDLANKRKDLELLGATFDEYGNISNYIELVSKKQQILNKLIDKYNKLVEKYNKATSEKKKKDLEERIQKFEKQIQAAEKQLDDLQSQVKQYDSLQEDMADVQEQIEDDIQQQIQINIKKFRMSIEIRLEMGEAERDWNKFVREVMHHTDVIKDSPFDKIFQDAKQQLDDVMSYFDVHGAGSTLTALVNQMYATKDQIEQINATGWSSIYGDNNGTAMQDLQSDLDTLMSQMQDIESLLDNIDQAYLDTIDDVQDNFDKQIDDYEYVTDLIEHDIDLLELLYGEKNYNAMNEYYTTLERNQTNQLDALRKQAEFWKKQWQGAAAVGDSEAAKKFEENYRQALNNLNSVIEEAAQTIQNKYINVIDRIFDTLDKKISNGLGTGYLDMQWQLMNKNAETYLDTVNAAFAIQELQIKYNKAINDTKSIKNQQTLKELMDEQLENLRNKEKISQYDVDRAEKLLQIEQARIALEDAQSSKTSLRLKRDSQGNYSYQYVSDADKALQAQQKLNEAQNDLYNFDKQAYKSNLDEMLAMWEEFQEKYRQIVLDTSLTEEQRIKDLALLREEYGEKINALTEKNSIIRQNLLSSTFDNINNLYQQDVANYQQMSDEQKNILMGDLIPMWTSGIQKMADKVAKQGGFIPMCKEAFEQVYDATRKYKEELNDMARVAGINLMDVRSGVDELSMSFQNLIMDNNELISCMFQEISAIQELRMEAQALVMQYQNVYQSALQAASAIHEFIQAQRAQAAAQAEMMAAMQQQAAAPAAAPAPAPAAAPAASSGNSNGKKGKDYVEVVHTVQSTDGSGSLEVVDYRVYPTSVRKGGGGSVGGAKMARFSSGGYTGDWETDDGRLAVLHQKELVLNQSDTQNLLNSVQILRDLANNTQLGLTSRLSDIELFRNSLFNESKDTIEQNVQITATFPNVNSKQQIEDAFNDLINLAAQRAMRNQ